MRKPSLATALKHEVRRFAGREVQRALRPLRKMQRQLSALKLLNRKQRRALRSVEKRFERLRDRVSAGAKGGGGTRYAASIRALRARLRMTRVQFAKVVGVSAGSVFLWETGRTVPRGGSLARLEKVRRMGVRQARAQADAPARARSVRSSRRRRAA